MIRRKEWEEAIVVGEEGEFSGKNTHFDSVWNAEGKKGSRKGLAREGGNL